MIPITDLQEPQTDSYQGSEHGLDDDTDLEPESPVAEQQLTMLDTAADTETETSASMTVVDANEETYVRTQAVQVREPYGLRPDRKTSDYEK